MPPQQSITPYYRYCPERLENGGSGPAHNPWVGDVQPGRIYEVPAVEVPRFAGAADWEPATEKEFRAQ